MTRLTTQQKRSIVTLFQTGTFHFPALRPSFGRRGRSGDATKNPIP